MTDQHGAKGAAPEVLETDILDLRELLQIGQRRWMLIAGVTVLAVVAALLITINITKLYTASSLVLIESRESRVVDIESVMSGLPADSGTIESQVEILRSQTLAARVVDELDLINDPEFNGSLREDGFSILDWIDPRTWWAAIRGPSDLNVSERERAARIRNSVISAVQGRMQVRRRGLTYVLEINFTSESPDKAARIANSFADLYIVDQLEARFEETRRANEWLGERLEGLREQVRLAETAAATFAAENNLISSGEGTVTQQQMGRINEQLIVASADLAEAEANYDRVRQIVEAGGNIETVNSIVQSPTVARLREQQTTLRREEAELAGRYGDRHPDLINVRQEIREVQSQLQSELTRIVSSLENDVALARNRVASLEAALSATTEDQAAANQAMVRLRELERNAEIQRNLYENFLGRFSETTQQENLQTSDARIIADAIPPLGPSHPQTQVNLALGGVLGLMAGCGLALLIEWLDRGLRTREQLENYLDLPQIAAVPMLTRSTLKEVGDEAEPEDFVLLKPLSSYTESLRALRAGIALSNVDNPPKVVLVTSALPNEGKTTLAISMARLAAASGARTLLIDADMRHPTVHKKVGMVDDDVDYGLVDLLAEDIPLGQVLRRDTTENLYLLLGGRRASNPTDLLESARMRQFLKTVRDEFDIVIIDAAPVLPVVDSRILSRLVDTTVFAVRWHDTPRDAAKDALRLLRDFDGTIAGAVLTLVDLDRQKRYGYGSSYYYYGRYREYYAD